MNWIKIGILLLTLSLLNLQLAFELSPERFSTLKSVNWSEQRCAELFKAGRKGERENRREGNEQQRMNDCDNDAIYSDWMGCECFNFSLLSFHLNRLKYYYSITIARFFSILIFSRYQSKNYFQKKPTNKQQQPNHIERPNGQISYLAKLFSTEMI